jgi:hypothetical protein
MLRLGLGINKTIAAEAEEAFDIGSIDGLKLWLKNDTGITEVGGKVSLWEDQSSNSNNAAQTITTRRPTISGKNIIFDGADDRFDLTSEFSVDEFTIAVIINPLETTPSNESILGKGANDFLRVHQGSQLDRVYMKANGVSMDQANLQSDLPAGTFLLVVTRATGTTDNAKVRVDGVDISEAARDNFDSTARLDIATIATSGGGLNPFDGYINEVVVFDSALTGDDLTNVEADIMSRNGLS